MAELRLSDPRDTLKMIRETLCVAQQAVGDRHDHGERIGRMINEIDRQRPLGVNGKHGNRHTPTCGCELPETDPRYLAPFMSGVTTARMAIVKHGWTADAPLTVAEALALIDNERKAAIEFLAAERGGVRDA